MVAIGDLPEVIDPIYPDTEVTRWVLSLTTFSVFDMISEHEVRDGGREHRIRIAEQLFHDGEKVRPEDVKYGYDRILEEGYRGAYREFASKLIEVEIVDHDLFFRFRRPVRIEDEGFRLAVVRRFSVEEGEIVGSGLYRRTVTEPGRILLERAVEPLTEADAPVESMEFVALPYPEAKRAIAEGRVDLIRIPRERAEANWAKKQDGLQLAIRDGRTMYYLGFGGRMMDLPPALRQAIGRSIDFESFLLKVFGGYATSLTYPVVSVEESKQALILPDHPRYSYSQLQQVFAEYGWVPGESGYLEQQDEIFSIRYVAFVDVDWSFLLAEYVKETLKEYGIRVDVQYLDYNTMMTMLENDEDLDMWGFAWEMPFFGTPEPLFSSKEAGLFNFGKYYDEVAEQQFQLLYQADKNAWPTYYETWYTIADRDMPVIPIGFSKDLWVANERIRLSELPLIRLHR